jgi:type I restriction enzyme M protein
MSDRIETLQSVSNRIFNCFSILRGALVGSDSSHVILLLLSLYRDKLISKEILSDQDLIEYKKADKIISSSTLDLNSDYEGILPIFSSSLSKLSESALKELIDEIFLIDHTILSDNFAELFDSLLFKITGSLGRVGSESVQPVEITRLIGALSETQRYTKVFNPFAGLGSFAVEFNSKVEYLGQEINQRTWAIGALRLMAHNIPIKDSYICADSITNWPGSSNKFDLIVSNPPFGVRISHFDKKSGFDYKTLEQLLILKGLESLNDGGKMITLHPHSILFQSTNQYKSIRQLLIDEDLLETVIQLPGGLLSHTNVPLVILVVNKKKNKKGKVLLVKADNFIKSIGPKNVTLNDSALKDEIYRSEPTSENVRLVDIEEIQEWNYNLSIPRYFQKEVLLNEEEKLVKLKDILKPISRVKGNTPEIGRLVRIRDLQSDSTDFYFRESDVEKVSLNVSRVDEIRTTCVLLAANWQSLKPTYFKYNGESIFISKDIYAFELVGPDTDLAYVINELHSDYVQEQLDAYRTGTTVPHIGKSDLLEVSIKLPRLEEQKAKVKGIFEISDKIKSLQEERDALAKGLSDKLYESTSTIKHSLGKPLLNIGSSLRNIERAMSKLDANWQNIKLNERYDLNIKDSFDSVYNNLDLIHSLLSKNETVLDVSEYELTELDFLAFMKGYVSRIKSAERPNVNVTLDFHPDIKKQLKNKITILANPDLLEIGLNAIVENANMHAFTDYSKKYKLEFRVSLYIAPIEKKYSDETTGRFETSIRVEVSNNGKPFPENYTLDKLVRKNSFAGETGNTGQGGFDLNEIVKYHNKGISTLELITEDQTSEFSTTYSFLIPINQ